MNKQELNEFNTKLVEARYIPKQMQKNMENWRGDADPMDMLQAFVSALAGYYDEEFANKDASYEKAKALTKEDGSISNKDFPVTFFDIRFGNLCNLKCVMCSPTDSNQWYDDYNKIWGYKSFMDSHEKIELVKNKKGKLQPSSNIYEWSDDPHIWNQIYKHIEQN